MIPVLLLVVFFAASSNGGTLCPPRENIYPCSCANIHQTKKIIHTIVYCHRLKDADVLQRIFSTLKSMQIDQFHLYDSFWEVEKLGDSGDMKKVLPTDWLTLLQIKEIEIVDSALAPCFACQWKLNCKNRMTTRFTAVNISSSDKICALCDTGRGAHLKFPWTGCLTKLKHFHFSHGRLTSVGADLFSIQMKELTNVNLTYNQIAEVDANAFRNLPRLTSLDLSHNAIETLDFLNFKTGLTFLDVSSNQIKIIGDTLLKSAVYLKTLNLEHNDIQEMKESHWKNTPESLKYINLGDNPLRCDCNIRWINSTFHINVVLLGTCVTPDEFENTDLRRASRFLNERCDGDGNIGTRARSVPTTPM